MKKIFLLLSLGIAAAINFGCGDTTERHAATEKEQTQITVIASNKISITVGQEKGVNASSIKASQMPSQSVEIEANVPEFMTFNATSNIFFNVKSLTSIEADGVITLDVLYNDLTHPDLQSCRVRAHMIDQNGLAGNTMPDSIIPLDIKVVGIKSYQKMTTAGADMKVWNAPFGHVIKETLVFKLRGDFSNAFKQVYRGTLVLDFVRDETITGAIYFIQSDGLYKMNLDGSNKKLIRSDVNNHDCQGLAFDAISNNCYLNHWDQPGQITKVPLNVNQPVVTLFNGASYGGQGLVVDASVGKLFSGLYYGGLYSANMDGTGGWTQLVSSAQVYPGHGVRGQVALDPVKKQVYFRSPHNFAGNTAGRKIWRVNYNGSNLTKIQDCLDGDALAFDQMNQKLYFVDSIGPTDSLPCKLVRSNIDGSNREDIFNINEPYEYLAEIFVDAKNGKMYLRVADNNAGALYKEKIMRCNLDGSNLETIDVFVPSNYMNYFVLSFAN